MGCHNSPSWLYADSPGMTSWRTLKKRKVLTPTTSAWPLASDKYYCLAIVDLPFIVAQDWNMLTFCSGVRAMRSKMVSPRAAPYQERLQICSHVSRNIGSLPVCLT